MGYLGLILALAAGGMGAYASRQAGQAQSAMATYNAAVATREAAAARETAALEEAQQRRRTRVLRGQQQTAVAVSGIQMVGSPLLVMEETAAQTELDALAIRRGGEITARRYESEATLSRMRARQYRRAGRIGGYTSILGGLAQAFGIGSRI